MVSLRIGERQTEQAASLGVVCSYPFPEIEIYSVLNFMSCVQYHVQILFYLRTIFALRAG